MTTTAAERASYASIALLVAEEAAELVMGGYRSRPSADEKGRHDLVTRFDRASEELILARLGSLAPGIPIIAEEGSEDGGHARRDGLAFYVDPLDGTTNFVHGHPFFSVAVGLMEDEQPVAGAVVAPAIGVRWIGAVDPKREGARQTRSSSRAVRNGAPCSVSVTGDLDHALLATGFPPNRDDPPNDNLGSFVAMKRAAQGVRRCGSAAIDLCLVADGTYDAYWERRLHAWDTVAASAIALAAGAQITSLDGGPADYHVGNLIASNGLLHEAIVAILAGPLPAPR